MSYLPDSCKIRSGPGVSGKLEVSVFPVADSLQTGSSTGFRPNGGFRCRVSGFGKETLSLVQMDTSTIGVSYERFRFCSLTS